MNEYASYITWLILSSLAFICIMAYLVVPFMNYFENWLRKRHYDKIREQKKIAKENRIKLMFNHSINSTK